jgi:hypothetical protein
MWSEVEREVNK